MSKMSELTLGSLFSGSGGFELAGLIAGIKPIWNCEVEPFAVRVTAKRLPDVKHYGDISELKGSEIEPVDVITGGFPCQSVSIAGKRAGVKHKNHGADETTRSGLFYEAARIIKEMREATNGEKPRYFVVENVPGLFSSNKGEDFRRVLEEIIQIVEPEATVPAPEGKGWANADYFVGNGWSVGYRVLDAQGWGVPQRRARIFLVADFTGQSAPEILFESEGLSGYTPQGFRSWQGATCDSQESLGKSGRTDEGCAGDRGDGGVIDALAVDGYNRSVSDKASTLGVNCGMSTGRNGIVLNDQGGNRMDITEDVTCTLRAEAHHPPVVLDEPQAFHINQRDEGIDLHGVSGALMATRNNQMQTFVVEQQEAVSAAGFCTEHSANARSIGYEEETSPTLRAGVVPAAIALENHPADSRVTVSEDGVVQTLTSRMGTGGGNVPILMEEELPARTLKIRSGCDGGGKGPIEQIEKSATLGCNNDQTLFQPKAYGICSKASNAMLSDNPYSGFYEADTARTLDANGGRPDCAQGGIAIVAQPTYSLQGNMIGREEKNGPQGSGVNEDVSFTLDATDRHGVAYCMTTGSYTQIEKDKTPTLMARDFKDPPVVNALAQDTANAEVAGTVATGAHSTDFNDNDRMVVDPQEPYYIVRRLTPTECARLQGFPDWWCSDLGIENPTEEDIRFWSEVWETRRRVTGAGQKPKTEKQIIKWLKNPHTDSAEYRLWGNGVCLPIVYFVLSGIAWAANKS